MIHMQKEQSHTKTKKKKKKKKKNKETNLISSKSVHKQQKS